MARAAMPESMAFISLCDDPETEGQLLAGAPARQLGLHAEEAVPGLTRALGDEEPAVW